MTLVAGKLIVATPDLADPNFNRTVVFLIQADEDGALGVVLTRPTPSLVVEHLPDLVGEVCDPPVVFIGGPVEPAVAITLESSTHPTVPTALAGVGIVDISSSMPFGSCRVFSGYSGWGPGQLEDEIAEGAWFVVEARPSDVFDSSPESLWSAVLQRQPGRLALFATMPPDPTLN
jgi:putative transcriptional regulator